MAKAAWMGIAAVIIGGLYTFFSYWFSVGCVAGVNTPLRCTIDAGAIWYIGIGFIITGIGIGLLLANYKIVKK